MPDKIEKKNNRIKGYAIWIGILYLIMQHSLYLAGHYLALWLGFTPFLPKIALDNRIPIVSVFIVPYIWSYAYWAMGPMAVSKCGKEHFADYMAANLVACLAGVFVLAFFPTYMDTMSLRIRQFLTVCVCSGIHWMALRRRITFFQAFTVSTAHFAIWGLPDAKKSPYGSGPIPL